MAQARKIELLTFRNGEKSNQDKGILVGSAEVVMYISDRKVNRVVFVLAGRNRDSGLVASQDDGDEHCSMCIWINRDDILFGWD